MKFLIAIGSKDYSSPTLELGMRVAKAFNAAVDIVYVGEKISAFSTSEVKLAQENLDNWEIDRKGVDVLQWAYEYLVENKYIRSDPENSDFNTDKLVQTDDDRCEVHLEGRMTKMHADSMMVSLIAYILIQSIKMNIQTMCLNTLKPRT